MLSFALDDGNVSQVEEIYPILKRFGFCATFYVIADRIGSPGRLSFDDLRLLESEGNEVGSHGLSHRPLTRLTSEEIEAEVNGSFQVLRRFRARSFAYPFGSYDDRVLKVVSQYYDSGRSYSSGTIVSNRRYAVRRYELESFPIEGRSQYLIDVNSEGSVFSQRSTLLTEDWYILTLHGRASFASGIRGAFRRSNLNPDQVRSYMRDLRSRLAATEPKLGKSFMEKLWSYCAKVRRLGIPVVTVSEGLEEFCP